MAQKGSKFKLGFFVLTGLLILAGSLVWMSADKFKGAKTYVTYFSESIQGLQVDSPVKYQGIDIGRVSVIDVAPDSMLVEVIMQIKTGGPPLEDYVVAKISLVGITGIAYIELTPQTEDSKSESPKLDFVPPYPVIPSNSKTLTKALNSLSDTLDRFSKIDFTDMANKLTHIVTRVDTIINSEQVDQILESLNNTSQNIEKFSVYLNEMAEVTKQKRIIYQLAETANSITELTRILKTEIDQFNLGEVGENANRYINDIGSRFVELADKMLLASESLSKTAANLELLSKRLAESPSEVIFSKPPEPLPQEVRK